MDDFNKKNLIKNFLIDKRAKHSWNQPEPDSNVPKLHLYNSFTRKKNLFVPINAKRVSVLLAFSIEKN